MQKQRKHRVVFTVKKDVRLLGSALGYNPWQIGDDMWKEVVSEMAHEYGEEFTVRALKNRVDLLIDKFKKKQLKYCSGTEEEATQRGLLLESIIAIKEEESAAINTELNCDDDDIEIVGDETDGGGAPENKQSKAKKRKLERLEADKERELYIDEAPGPSGSRSSRQRLSVEEEIMMEKHRHEIQIENQKIEVEKLRIGSEQRREEQRLILEQQREERLGDESKRRDEIAKTQIELQRTMMEIMKKFMDK